MEDHCHDEKVCHTVGEARAEQVKALREILDSFNVESEHEKLEEERKEEQCKKKTSCGTATLSLLDVPEYWYRATLPPKAPDIPTITSIPCMTVKFTGNKNALKDQNPNLQIKFIKTENPHAEPPWLSNRKSIELRAGQTYQGCDCVKFNGLQDKCPRSECQGSAECLTKPYPHCQPSISYPGPRSYIKPTTVASQTEPACCNCKLDGSNDINYRASGCYCQCHMPPQA